MSKLKKFGLVFFVVVVAFIAPLMVKASFAESLDKQKYIKSPNAAIANNLKCSPLHATYKPLFDRYLKDLDFTLTIAEGVGTPGPFFIFTAYDIKTKTKVSALRMGWVCSNGTGSCSINTEDGQYALEGRGDSFNPTMVLNVLAVNKDFTEAWPLGKDDGVPPMLMFPKIDAEFMKVKSHSEYWNKYIKFYTKDKILPDFSDIDAWILSECKDGSKFIQKPESDVFQ
jgi:hypothetical protein